MRAAVPSTYHSLLPSWTPPLLPIPLLVPSTSRRAEIPKADTPPRKRLLLTAPRPRCEEDRAAVRAVIEVLRRKGLTYEQESIQICEALARSKAYIRTLEARVAVLETQAHRHEWQHQTADDFAVQHIMCTQAPEAGARVDTLEDTGSTRDALKSINGDDSHNSGTGVRRTERAARESENQVKFATCTLHSVALTWWNTQVKIVGHDAAYESDKIEKYIRGLPDMIHGSVVASKPKTMQEAVAIVTELMDQKIRTFAKREMASKRKLENTSGSTQNQQQQPNKRQNTGRVYTAASGERKEYAGTLPLCNKCKFLHNGRCTIKCANCKRVGHLSRDCRSPAATNNHKNPTCYEYGNQGHYRSDCPELKNQDHGNQAGGTGAHEMVKEKPRKGQNRIKTRQKREARRGRKKFKAVAVNRGRKTEQNAKRMAENANAVKSYSSFKKKEEKRGQKCNYLKVSTTGAKADNCPKLYGQGLAIQLDLTQ
nr:hypothetical protein [Tanacetum cinerariifolium]